MRINFVCNKGIARGVSDEKYHRYVDETTPPSPNRAKA